LCIWPTGNCPREFPEELVLPHETDFVASHRGNYATIPNYLIAELRYMDAG
jgi:hypothetical protein